MAITPSAWAKVLTIPESYTPSSATSGQTLVITESVIAKLSAGDQAAFWSNVENGGGDVRICENSDGTNQLPVEIVGLDNQAKTCVIWTRKPTYNGTGSLYVFIGKDNETQPLETDPFGRNAVWSGLYHSLHLESSSPLDSTDGSAFTRVGTTTIVDGVLGKANQFSGGQSFKKSSKRLDTSFVISFWVKVTNPAIAFIYDDSISTNGGIQVFKQSNGTIRLRVDDSGSNNQVLDSPPVDDGNWHHVAYRLNKLGNLEVYVDGGITATGASLTSYGNISPSSSTSYFADREIENAKFIGLLDEFTISNNASSAEYIATEYANQNDPASFYGTPTLADTGGGGVVNPDPQAVTSIIAEQITQANTLPIDLASSLTSIVAQQNEQASAIDIFIAQLVNSISANEKHETQNLTIEQTASQSINSITAEQNEQASFVSVSQSGVINSIDAQEAHQANALTIEQSAGQSINLINAEQIEQANSLSATQLQSLSAIVSEQVSSARTVDVTSLQAITMIVAEESHGANALNIQQYTGQLVTLITAQQIDEAETLFISEVSAVDILQAEQSTEAQTVAFSQAQRISTITAEQLTEVQILSVISSGDNTDLSGLRLIPITAKYQITPTNPTRYTLTKV